MEKIDFDAYFQQKYEKKTEILYGRLNHVVGNDKLKNKGEEFFARFKSGIIDEFDRIMGLKLNYTPSFEEYISSIFFASLSLYKSSTNPITKVLENEIPDAKRRFTVKIPKDATTKEFLDSLQYSLDKPKISDIELLASIKAFRNFLKHLNEENLDLKDFEEDIEDIHEFEFSVSRAAILLNIFLRKCKVDLELTSKKDIAILLHFLVGKPLPPKGKWSDSTLYKAVGKIGKRKGALGTARDLKRIKTQLEKLTYLPEADMEDIFKELETIVQKEKNAID